MIFKDPHETNNLIFEPEHQPTVTHLNKRLFELLKESNGLNLRLAQIEVPHFLTATPKDQNQANSQSMAKKRSE